MSVARCLGVEDGESPLMRKARDAWSRWCATERALDVVDDFVDLPDWMRRAGPPQRDTVLATLAKLGADDSSATAAVTWLLVPGATALAVRLRDLSPDIDALVAAQLWLTAKTYDVARPHRVAATLLSRTRREVMTELGVGDPGRRRDRAWAAVIPMETLPEVVAVAADELDPAVELRELLQMALDSGVLTESERNLLFDLAHAAEQVGAPLRRGRAGLSTPSVAELVSRDHELSARTVRRKAVNAIDELSTFASTTVGIRATQI